MNSPSSAGAATEIAEAFAEAGIQELPPTAYLKFAAYLELLLRWNARLNLTAIREPDQIIRRHFVECAFAAQHLPEDIDSLMDYGSGPGLPGVPIAICRPGIHVTLTEAQGKKASFLREVVRAIGTATEIYDGRAESLLQNRHFHAVSMRAVEKMELAIPTAIELAERYLVLLTTKRSASAYEGLTQVRWMDPVLLPNAEEMILAIGKRTA